MSCPFFNGTLSGDVNRPNPHTSSASSNTVDNENSNNHNQNNNSNSKTSTGSDYFSAPRLHTVGAPVVKDADAKLALSRLFELSRSSSLASSSSSSPSSSSASASLSSPSRRGVGTRLFEEDPNTPTTTTATELEGSHSTSSSSTSLSSVLSSPPRLSPDTCPAHTLLSGSNRNSNASNASNANEDKNSNDTTLDPNAPKLKLGRGGHGLRLWTGAYRTSLGVEVTHPLSLWMKGVSDRDFSSSSDKLSAITRSDKINNSNNDADEDEDEAGDDVLASAIAPRFPKEQKRRAGERQKKKQEARGLVYGAKEENNIKQKYTDTITYWNYIHPEVLTSLQTGRQGKGLNHHDEHLFILVHQVFELWFKQILFELEYVRDALLGNTVESGDESVQLATERLHRADLCMRLATRGYEIMETMDPAHFLEFRDFLSPSSGFQSTQLREIEILIGLKDDDRVLCAGRHYREAFYSNGEDKTASFDRRLKQKSIKDAVYTFLSNLSLPESDAFIRRYLSTLQSQTEAKVLDARSELTLLTKMRAFAASDKEVEYVANLERKAQSTLDGAQATFRDVEAFFTDKERGTQRSACLLLWTYHSHPLYSRYAALLRVLIEFEQGTLLWRQRHARMVECFIGRRVGTGGSSGVEYIELTASKYRVFQDLWTIRSLMMAKSKIDFDPIKERTEKTHINNNNNNNSNPKSETENTDNKKQEYTSSQTTNNDANAPKISEFVIYTPKYGSVGVDIENDDLEELN